MVFVAVTPLDSTCIQYMCNSKPQLMFKVSKSHIEIKRALTKVFLLFLDSLTCGIFPLDYSMVKYKMKLSLTS